MTAVTSVSQIITLTDLIDYLATRGLSAGEAAEIAHKGFRLGIESVKPRKKPKQLSLIDKETTWPEDFAPTPALLRYATERGFDERTAQRMWDKFRNKSQSLGKRFIKWDAAWRTWVDNELDYAEKSKAPRPEQNSYIDGRL